MRNDICICMKNFVALSVFCFAVLFISQQGRSRDDGPALLGRHWRRGAAGGDAMDRAIGETANSKNSSKNVSKILLLIGLFTPRN